MSFSRNKECPKCKTDKWWTIDNSDILYFICENCLYSSDKIVKKDFVDNFECKNCGCVMGELVETKKHISVKCMECGKVNVVFTKPEVTIDNVDVVVPSAAEKIATAKLKCPRCGSTAVTTGQRGFSILTGFLGSNKTVNRCGKCGYTWKP